MQQTDTSIACCWHEKSGVQAIGATAPDLPPKPGIRATLSRDHEYKRHGALSLLAGIDLLILLVRCRCALLRRAERVRWSV
jgi:hypothetical protein